MGCIIHQRPGGKKDEFKDIPNLQLAFHHCLPLKKKPSASMTSGGRKFYSMTLVYQSVM